MTLLLLLLGCLFLWSRGLSALPLLVIAVIVWAVMQGREQKTAVWASRAQRVLDSPLRKHIAADIHATIQYTSTWRIRVRDRQAMKKIRFDDI